MRSLELGYDRSYPTFTRQLRGPGAASARASRAARPGVGRWR